MAQSDLEILQEYFDATSKLDIERAKSLFHKDMVIEAPFTPEVIAATVPQRMEGPATHAMYDALPQMVLPMNFSNIEIYPLKEEGGFLATYQSNTKMIVTGRPYRQKYISRFQIKEGKIILIAEYYDSCILLTAMGGSVKLG